LRGPIQTHAEATVALRKASFRPAYLLPSNLHEPTIFSQLLTRAIEAELKSQAGPAYRVVKQRKAGAPRPMKMGTAMLL
jgi:hypothetical protein